MAFFIVITTGRDICIDMVVLIKRVQNFIETMYSFEIWDKQERVDYKKIDYEYQVRKKICYKYDAKNDELNFWTE